MNLLIAILSERRSLLTALVVWVAFVVLYLTAMQYLIVAPGATEAFLSLEFLSNWRDLIFRQRGPFLFEPIGILEVGPLVLFVSIPNLAIGMALGLLVSMNVAVSYYGFRALGLRGARGAHALLGTIPALISGAACCVPTLILAIGLQFTATLAAIWPWLVPFSAVLLILSLWWSLHRMRTVCALE